MHQEEAQAALAAVVSDCTEEAFNLSPPVPGNGFKMFQDIARSLVAAWAEHRKGGLLDIVYDLNAKRYQDPGDQIIIHHIKAFKALLDAWPTDQLTHVAGAWAQLQEHLMKQQHPWYQVKGPMAEWQWLLQDLRQSSCVRVYGPELHIDLRDGGRLRIPSCRRVHVSAYSD